MFGNVLGIARWFSRLGQIFGSDARIAIIVSDPMVKEGTLDDFGAAIQGESNPQTPLLKGCSATTRCFFKLSSTPECHALRGHTAFGS
jgi:hypothetical protein